MVALLDFFKRKEDISTKKKSGRTIKIEHIGTTGTSVQAGYPTEEYLHKLTGRERARYYDEMRRSDTQVAMNLGSVKNPIKSATWEIDGDNENHVELINKILFEDINFDQFVSEALTACDFGHSVFEVTHAVKQGYIGLKNLMMISPKTIDKWNIDRGGNLISIEQQADGDLYSYIEIPNDFLLVFSIAKEGSNFEGISLLRPCYGPWFRKNTYLKLNAIGIEKFAVPTPIVEVPEGRENTPQFEAMKNALALYASSQCNYLTMPQGWHLTMNNSNFDPSKIELSIEAEDNRMTKAFLANFLLLTSGGSNALSRDLSSFFLAGLSHIAYNICSVINDKLIPSLIDLNFGKQKQYPKLKVSGIDDKAGGDFANVIKLLVDSGVVEPDMKLEEHMRERFDLPIKDEKTARKKEAPSFLSERKNSIIEGLKKKWQE